MKSFTSAVLALAVASQAYAVFDFPSKITRDEIPTLVKRQDKGKQSPSTFPIPNSPQSHGCYSSAGNMTMQKNFAFMSSGSCNDACKSNGFWVSGLHGANCFCGFAYPPDKDVADDKKCNYPCAGYDLEACGALGSPGYYSVFNTGVNVEALPLPDSSSTSTSQTSTAPQTQNQPTAPNAANPAPQSTTPATSDAPQQSGGTNTAGIAAGAVAGVVGAAAIIGGIIFFIRRRRNSEIEEEHRRNAAVSAFINGSKPPGSSGSVSMADARLDPVMANRRMSDGSIADNQDYSRRILRVTNA